jgi:hypothetical protein
MTENVEADSSDSNQADLASVGSMENDAVRLTRGIYEDPGDGLSPPPPGFG